MTASRRRTLLLGVLFPLVLLVVALGVMLATLPGLPDPVAVHWGPSGSPDGFGSPWLSFVLLPVIGLGYLVLPILVARRITAGPTINQRILLAIGPFLIGFLGTLVAGSLVIQVGLEDARTGPSILPVLALAFGVGLAGAVAVWFLLPPTPAIEQAPDAASLPARALALDERVVWVQRIAPRTPALGVSLLVLSVLVVGAALVFAIVQPWALLLLGIPILLIVTGYACSFWTVTIDRHGVLARGGFGHWPVVRIPLAEIESARVVETDSISDFGGWGLRWTPRRTGIILRSGEALEVTRTGDRALVLTMDDAAAPAELLNALVLRARGTVQ